MIYILVFIICLITDKARKESAGLYFICVCIITIILCFGYTCGSDWRNYELIYNNLSRLKRYESTEFGFVLLVRFFKLFISDFWVFNALMKMCFLYALIKFFSFFTKMPWMCIGLSFAFKTLFLIIDCPMRFMIAMSFMLIAVPYFFRKEWGKFILLSIIAITFHSTMIFVCGILLLLLYSKYIVSIKPIYLFAICIICLFLSNFISIYQYAFTTLFSFIGSSGIEDNRAAFYAVFKENTSFSIETFWHYIFLILILLKRDFIINMKYGAQIFSASWLYISVSILVNPVPTSFRLSILLGYFFVMAICIIIKSYRNSLNITNVGVVLWLMLIITKDVYSLPAYYPYTNSIWYILTEHQPYNYRHNYNYIKYKETFGKLPKRPTNDGTDLK